ADIEANGLAHPIVLDADGVLIDGRNRLRACEVAGAEPSYELFDGPDPAAYILSSNLARRSLTKGQAAMVAAKALALGAPYRNYTDGPSRGYISHAAVVLAHAPGLADAVIAGALSLDEAYVRAREIKAAAESDEARLAQLRSEFPDLADKVTEEALTLTAALVEARERNAARRRDAEQAADAAQTIVARTQSAVVAILLGREQGVENLITKDTIEALRAAIDHLETPL